MSKEYELEVPKEGANTLFAQFSVVKVDEVVRMVKDAVERPEDIPEYLEEAYPEMSAGLVEKIALLAVGETPGDDFDLDVLAGVEQPDENTVNVTLHKGAENWESGDLVYFRGQRWIVGSRTDAKLVLKHF